MNKNFDSNWLIELMQDQHPDKVDVIRALEKCTSGNWESSSYVHFVSSQNANKPGSEWQFKENIILKHKKEGTIILDYLMDGRIGGIEFVSKIK